MADSEDKALHLTLARLLEGQLDHVRELMELRGAYAREMAELRTAHAREMAEARNAHSAALAGIEQELQRHRETETTQADVVKAYAASLEADRRALAELRAVKAEGRAGAWALLADQRVISALMAVGAAIAAYFLGASNGSAAPPPP